MFLTLGGLARRDRHVAFDIQVRAQKASPFTQMSRNEQAKELYRLGFFRPDLANQALIALEMMDFDGIETVKKRVAAQAALQQSTTIPNSTVSGTRQGAPLTVAQQQIPKVGRSSSMAGEVSQ